jgi:hypothetical protein
MTPPQEWEMGLRLVIFVRASGALATFIRIFKHAGFSPFRAKFVSEFASFLKTIRQRHFTLLIAKTSPDKNLSD